MATNAAQQQLQAMDVAGAATGGNDDDDAMDTTNGNSPLASPPSSPGTPGTGRPQRPHGSGPPVLCPSCQCSCEQSKGARACCSDYAVKDEGAHQLHFFACACGETCFHCPACHITATSIDDLHCSANSQPRKSTVLHVWVPKPAASRESNLQQPDESDYGETYPANVQAACDTLRLQAKGHVLSMLMKVVLEETKGRAFMTQLHRGHDDGR